MNENQFYLPRWNSPPYAEIATKYAAAFAREPWREVSACPDRLQRCTAGLSSLAIGEFCRTCLERPTEPAYPTNELVRRFEELAANKPGLAWYTEDKDGQLAFAALAWTGQPADIATEKYSDTPAMGPWLTDTLGGADVVWLDEVFADTEVRPNGNLDNFGVMCRQFMDKLGCGTLAFRTINPRMTRAALRDFGADAAVFERQADVPDRRDFVVIRKTQEEQQ